MYWCNLTTCLLLLSPVLGVYHILSCKNFTQDARSFGYSLTYEPGARRLVVGAPFANFTGEVFTCDVEKQKCNAVKKNIETKHNKEYEQDILFGVNVKGGSYIYFLTCAPQHLNISLNPEDDRIGVYSDCFKCENSKTKKSESNDYTCNKINVYDDSFRKTGEHFERDFLSFGWSMDMLDEEFLIGGPAMGTGKVLHYAAKDESYNMVDTADDIKYNWGYGVALGDFVADTRHSFALSSTYGSGKVLIVNSRKIKTSLNKGEDSDLLGSLYGAVLCAANLRRPEGKKKIMDLFVGAPAFGATSNTNDGAVYIYSFIRGIRRLPIFIGKIKAPQPESLFGASIVSLGDLNNDFRDEIAIGAPNENNGTGAVYIYSGADIVNGILNNYIQKIVPDDSWKSFGASLTALDDYDDNGCNELAIGAPESKKVVLLRCLTSIVVKLDPEFPDFAKEDTKQVEPRTSFVYGSCFKVTYPMKPSNIETTIEIRTEIVHPHAKLALPDDGIYNETIIKPNLKYCKDITVSMPLGGNYNIKIDIKTKASIINDPENEPKFNPNRAKLSSLSYLENKYSFHAGSCNGKERCEPVVEHLGTKLSEPSPYLIGSTASLAVSVLTKNRGDIAYDACMYVYISAPLKRMPPVCEDSDLDMYTLKCKPIQLVRTNSSWSIDDIIIDTGILTSESADIAIQGVIYSVCVDQGLNSTFSNLIALKNDNASGVQITRAVGVESSRKIEHRYMIYNNGPTNWAKPKLTLEVEKQPFFMKENIHLQVGDNSTCESFDSEGDKYRFHCEIKTIMKKAPTPIIIEIDVLAEKLGIINTNDNLTVSSHILLEMRQIKLESSLFSRLPFTPLWVIILACIIGLVVLVVLAYILYRYGCLRRKNKVMLRQVRQSVRRQTIIRERQSRLGSHSRSGQGRSDDDDIVIEGPKISDEATINELKENIKKRNAAKKDKRVVVD